MFKAVFNEGYEEQRGNSRLGYPRLFRIGHRVFWGLAAVFASQYNH